MTGPQAPSQGATYRTLRELGSRAQRTLAAIREPNELVVVQTFAHAPASIAREARALAKNWHPNLARVRYVDDVGDELVVATDLVDGVTLEELFALGAKKRSKPADPLLPLPVLARIVVDVLGGLQGLHGLRDEANAPLGAFHGATCPRNVIVGKDGVARIVALFRPRPVRIAATAESLRYASPEALEPGSAADPRTDLYAAAAIAWEGIVGRQLWEEELPSRIAQRQREEDILWVEGSDPTLSNVGRVVLRALAFDPSVRYRSAFDLATELRKAVGAQLATGSAVAQKVGELAGERIRSRRLELEPPGAKKPASTKMQAAPIAKPAPAQSTMPVPPPTFEEEPPTARGTAVDATPKPPPVASQPKKPPPPIPKKPPPPAPVSDQDVQDALVSVRELPKSDSAVKAAGSTTKIGLGSPLHAGSATKIGLGSPLGVTRKSDPKLAASAPRSDPALAAAARKSDPALGRAPIPQAPPPDRPGSTTKIGLGIMGSPLEADPAIQAAKAALKKPAPVAKSSPPPTPAASRAPVASASAIKAPPPPVTPRSDPSLPVAAGKPPPPVDRSEAATEPPPPVEPRLDPHVVLAPQPNKPQLLLAVTPTPPPAEVAFAERTTDAGVDVPISLAPPGDEREPATRSIALFLSQPVPAKKAARWVVVAVAIAMLTTISVVVIVTRSRAHEREPALGAATDKTGSPPVASAPPPKTAETADPDPAPAPSSTAAASEAPTPEPAPAEPPPSAAPAETTPVAPPPGPPPATAPPVKKKPLYEPMGI